MGGLEAVLEKVLEDLARSSKGLPKGLGRPSEGSWKVFRRSSSRSSKGLRRSVEGSWKVFRRVLEGLPQGLPRFFEGHLKVLRRLKRQNGRVITSYKSDCIMHHRNDHDMLVS